MHRVDLHTHSAGSPDGALRLEHYRRMLETGGLGTIAITDHDTTSFAQEARRVLGERIVVGEEVTTAQGELIGLYLRETVQPGQAALVTARAIHDQGGLVYVPHPFETVRRGMTAAVLDGLAPEVDIVETFNGRAWAQNRGAQAREWAQAHTRATAASSDAHGPRGWGRTYTELSEVPERTTLVELLKQSQQLMIGVGGIGLLYPKFNRLRRRWKQS